MGETSSLQMPQLKTLTNQRSIDQPQTASGFPVMQKKRVASASSSEEVTRLRARESNLVQQMQQVIVEAPETVEVSQRLSGLAPYVGRMG